MLLFCHRYGAERGGTANLRQSRGSGLFLLYGAVQLYARPELLFDVPAHCFIPQPKVTSAVVKLQIRQEPPAQILDEGMFFRTVRAAFAQRRKTLLNCLSAGFGEFGKAELTEIMEGCNLFPSVRGETLDIAQFACLSNALLNAKNSKES